MSLIRKFKKYLDVYFITTNKFGRSHEELAKIALEAGIRILQFREKNMCTFDMIKTGKEIRELCNSYDAIFIVNDRLDVALACDADGIHVGKNDMPPEIARKLFDGLIGYTAKSINDLKKYKDVVDYFGVGPIFPTSTKSNAGNAIGISKLKEFVSVSTRPIVAIGGINKNNVTRVLKSGVSGIAVISAIASSHNPKKSTLELLEIVRKFKSQNCCYSSKS